MSEINENCSHRKTIKYSSGHFLGKKFRCSECGQSSGNLWACLHCEYIGCSDSSSLDHSDSHFIQFSNHPLQINLSTKYIWCAICKAQVFIKDIHGSKSNRNGGLVGLSNLGNTCYMNAALQCLLNTPPLSGFFLSCFPHSDGDSLAYNYRKLVHEIWNSQVKYVAPLRVLHSIKVIYPMFRGFHQQDSQEFLRCFMDQLHKEVMEPNMKDETDEKNENEKNGKERKGQLKIKGHEVKENEDENENENEEENEDEEETERIEKSNSEEYETADSGVSEDSSSLDNSTKTNTSSSSFSSFKRNSEHFLMEPSSVSHKTRTTFKRYKASPYREMEKTKAFRSIVSDVFDGKLVSSVKCSTCETVSMTTETFQDLSLSIPSLDSLVQNRNLGSQRLNSENEGWLYWMWSLISGWFIGPSVSLSDCLEYFFSADELKGDNMYSCERCKKLRNGWKYSRVIVLPDTLCIHLKRFRHEFAFSSKISSKVTFPLLNLDLSQWLLESEKSKISKYNLTGVISHHGTSGNSGHYIAYCYNHVSQEWNEFDDAIVSRVDENVVLNAEAYVLFYRKVKNENSETLDRLTEEKEKLMGASKENKTFYISKQWYNKFTHMAEPGPIDNMDFMCSHGGIQPKKGPLKDLIVESVSSIAWKYLIGEFGGGPVCSTLTECSICNRDLEVLQTQKNFELTEFQQLYSEFQETVDESSVLYCLNISWFKNWEDFVMNRLPHSPGPIDNQPLLTTQNGVQVLRAFANPMKVSKELWNLFVSLYGGGPEITFYSENGKYSWKYSKGSKSRAPK